MSDQQGRLPSLLLELASVGDEHADLAGRAGIVIKILAAGVTDQPADQWTRATAKGTAIGVDEWDRPLYVRSAPPAEPDLPRFYLTPEEASLIDAHRRGAEPPSDDVERVRIAAALWERLPQDDTTRRIVLDLMGAESIPASIVGLAEPRAEPPRCIMAGCVATWAHSHGGFPGGYNNPDDPEGAPIPFTGPDPEPGAVRDYNGAALPAEPRAEGLRNLVAQHGLANLLNENHPAYLAMRDAISPLLLATLPQQAALDVERLARALVDVLAVQGVRLVSEKDGLDVSPDSLPQDIARAYADQEGGR